MSKQQVIPQNQKQQPQNIHQFLDDQVMNVVALWKQSTVLGSTHVLYNKAIIDGILNDLKNIHDTLQGLANQPPPPQNSPPKENKIHLPPTKNVGT